jgi:hypothetical protein
VLDEAVSGSVSGVESSAGGLEVVLILLCTDHHLDFGVSRLQCT